MLLLSSMTDTLAPGGTYSSSQNCGCRSQPASARDREYLESGLPPSDT
ncbi:transient receptor potential cation channel, subfamily M, member 5, isoform CRA_a [Mus musculus]|nr:transient receptor potential cation channel, subfamily M, member 5, isoform CRA_a [Mus musculus]